jgi:hypothetical protein
VTTSPADLLRMIYDDLSAWAAGVGGQVNLTRNPFELINLLQEEPTGWAITVHWEGDEPADDRVRAGNVMRNRLRLILMGRLGMTLQPSLGLIRKPSPETAFLDLVNTVRHRVMAYRFPWLAEPNNRLWYKGTDDKIELPDGLFLAAYNLAFQFYSTIDLPAEALELTPPS